MAWGWNHRGSPWGWLGTAWQPQPTPLPQPGPGNGGTRAALAPGIWQLSGSWMAEAGLGAWVGPAGQDSWPGGAGLWGTTGWRCCSIAAAGADGPAGLTWGPGLQVAGGPQRLTGALRAGGAIRTLTTCKCWTELKVFRVKLLHHCVL